MLSFLKKESRIKTILKKLHNIRKPNVQLDISRNKEIDFQIIRQEVIGNLNIDVPNGKGYGIFINFHKSKIGNEDSLLRFKNSSLLNQAVEAPDLVDGLNYFIFCKDELNDLINLVERIITEIYSFSNGEEYDYHIYLSQ